MVIEALGDDATTAQWREQVALLAYELGRAQMALRLCEQELVIANDALALASETNINALNGLTGLELQLEACKARAADWQKMANERSVEIIRLMGLSDDRVRLENEDLRAQLRARNAEAK